MTIVNNKMYLFPYLIRFLALTIYNFLCYNILQNVVLGVDTDMIHISGNTYEVVVDHKNGWNPEAFRERYSEVLEKYDYIIGDWGYNQLRLKGFYEAQKKVPSQMKAETMEEYLVEYCNFGCAHFILKKVNNPQEGKKDSQK